MKREDVKAHIEGITDEQLSWLMEENGKDINKEKDKAKKLEARITALEDEKTNLSTSHAVDKKNLEEKWNAEKADFESKISEMTGKLSAYDGVDVAALNQQVSDLKSQLEKQTEEYKFDTALNGAIRDLNGRSITAIRSLIDVGALKESKDLTADIAKALEACKTENPWAFADAENRTRVDLGDEHGEGSGGRVYEDWEQSFMEMNPEIKL